MTGCRTRFIAKNRQPNTDLIGPYLTLGILYDQTSTAFSPRCASDAFTRDVCTVLIGQATKAWGSQGKGHSDPPDPTGQPIRAPETANSKHCDTPILGTTGHLLSVIHRSGVAVKTPTQLLGQPFPWLALAPARLHLSNASQHSNASVATLIHYKRTFAFSSCHRDRLITPTPTD